MHKYATRSSSSIKGGKAMRAETGSVGGGGGAVDLKSSVSVISSHINTRSATKP